MVKCKLCQGKCVGKRKRKDENSNVKDHDDLS